MYWYLILKPHLAELHYRFKRVEWGMKEFLWIDQRATKFNKHITFGRKKRRKKKQHTIKSDINRKVNSIWVWLDYNINWNKPLTTWQVFMCTYPSCYNSHWQKTPNPSNGSTLQKKHFLSICTKIIARIKCSAVLSEVSVCPRLTIKQ